MNFTRSHGTHCNSYVYVYAMWSAVPCCAVPYWCRAVLCRAALRCAVLCCAVPCRDVLRCAVLLHFVMLSCIIIIPVSRPCCVVWCGVWCNVTFHSSNLCIEHRLPRIQHYTHIGVIQTHFGTERLRHIWDRTATVLR